MMVYSEGFGGNYELVRQHLTDQQLRDISLKVQNSKSFEVGEFSHVVLRGTETIVGYIGNDSVDLCCPRGRDPRMFRVPHAHLRRIFRSAR